MKLSQATQHFGYESIDVWDGTAFIPLDARKFSLAAFDRFLGPRSFGQKERILFSGEGHVIPSGYEIIRLSNGGIYLIMSHNQDMAHGDQYANTYVIRKADYSAAIISMVTTPAPSGIGGTVTPTQIATTFCDMERYTSEGSSELDVIRYGIFTFLFPISVKGTVTTAHDLRVDGSYYEIKEVSPLLEILEIRALKRDEA